MNTQAASASRRAAYEAAIEYALQAIQDARGVGCTTGTHIRDFLNAVGISAPGGDVWSVNSANRAVRHLVRCGLLKWKRNRGRRAAALEDARKKLFSKAIENCRSKYAAPTTRSKSTWGHRPIANYVDLSDDAIQVHPAGIITGDAATLDAI